jgi:AAA lid domain
VQVMENRGGALVVMLAGYADRMDCFFTSNPGFRSRVAHHIDFPGHDAREPMAIAELMLAGQRYRFSPAAREAFARHLEARMRQPHFANARPVRNALDRTRLRQAVRCSSGAAKARSPRRTS